MTSTDLLNELNEDINSSENPELYEELDMDNLDSDILSPSNFDEDSIFIDDDDYDDEEDGGYDDDEYEDI